jgi:hypothetical protein
MEMVLAILLVTLAAGWSWYSSQDDADESSTPDPVPDETPPGDLIDPPADETPDPPAEPDPDPVYTAVSLDAGGSFLAQGDAEQFEMNTALAGNLPAVITGFAPGVDQIVLRVPAPDGPPPPSDGTWRPEDFAIVETGDEVAIWLSGTLILRLPGVDTVAESDVLVFAVT